MELLTKENKKDFDKAIIKAIEDEYTAKVWEDEAVEFLVGNDDEAEKAYDETLDNLLEDIVLADIPENLQMYFDEEAWKRDAKINGWRGQELNRYDGKELEAEIDGETYYIYRNN